MDYIYIVSVVLGILAVYWGIRSGQLRSALAHAETEVRTVRSDLGQETQQRNAALEDRDAAKRLAEVHSEANDQLREASRVLADQLVEAAKAVSDSDGRARRYFEHIEIIEKERNQVWTLYDDARRGHATAQNMMMGEIDRLAHKAKIKLDPKFQVIADEYKARHDPDTGLGSKVERAPEPPKAPPDPNPKPGKTVA